MNVIYSKLVIGGRPFTSGRVIYSDVLEKKMSSSILYVKDTVNEEEHEKACTVSHVFLQ